MLRKWPKIALTPLCLGLILILPSCTHSTAPAAPQATPLSTARFEFSQPQMGVPFRIVLYAPNKLIARLAAKAAYKRIAELNQVLSDYETDSELSELSRTAGEDRWVDVSPDLWNVLERSQSLARLTDGAFDITVGPSVILWRYARRIKKMPDPVRLEQAMAAIGYKKLQLDPLRHRARLQLPGMKLDVGAIAKGYAVDEALKNLRAGGIRCALVAGSGDIAVSDPPPGKEAWRIELAPLDVTNAPPKRYLLLANSALATSGDIFQRLEIDGLRYSHIVDPHTGIGLTNHSLVTVIARDCTTADSLATAISVMGPDRGLKLLKHFPGSAAHIVQKPGGVIQMRESPAFKAYYEKNPPPSPHPAERGQG